MNRKLATRLTGAAFLTAVVAAALTAPAVSAAASTTGLTTTPTLDRAGAAASPQMLAAMQRDLGLTASQAHDRIAREVRAAATDRTLTGALDASYGGSWLVANADHLVVAVTDQGAATTVRQAGAEPRLVSHSLRELNSIQAQLDRHGSAAPRSVPGWHVDVTTNSVVVLYHHDTIDAARAFVASAGVEATRVRLVESTESPRPLYDVRGGDAYYINGNERCSVGFSVNGGFVSAGHCGTPGSTTAGVNQAAQGTFQASTFPGRDYSWVAVNSSWTPRGVVNDYSGGEVTVAGSTESPVGSSVCRSGSTSGWHCGTVQEQNASVTYPEGTVNSLTRTNACAEPGDSGGSWLTGQQAQGVTSGGSGDCTSGGTTYFQPVNPILAAYGLTLITSGGNPPPPPPTGCGGLAAWSASTAYKPGDAVSYNGHKWNSTWYSTGAQPDAPGSWAVWQDAGSC
ncbi:S1 family peptidase [Solihabitans fulvus]|uniref:S1 family peptidase n=1 Tax=Solihabitans fulvus TaxID=1892852 RepID=A0A5B2WTW0_9PSEU|nr:alpha-lytic protease prodomain-containing protein [Solihabitans fulvus]KAA2253869.1 S1 family peptidase [Solihabitans fulvus]